MSLTPRPWHGLAAFGALAPAWEELVREAQLDPLCNGHAWNVAYARAFAAEDEVLGWSFEENGQTIGILALRREPSRGPMTLRRALLVADGTFDSDYLDVPVRPGREPDVVRALLEATRTGPSIEALVLAGLPEDSRFLVALRAELAQRSVPEREHPVVCLSAPIPDSFEGYLAARKPRMRSKVRSAIRKAQERGARLSWCRDEGLLDAWLEELFRLHELRWQAEGRTGSFADPRRRNFYRAFTRLALEREQLCFARLEEGEIVTAIQLGVRCGARYYQVQEGFDPSYEDTRVGTALRGLALAELIVAGVRAYDFMAGDSAHKRDWGGEERPCTTIAFPLARWRARLAYGLRARVDRWRQ